MKKIIIFLAIFVFILAGTKCFGQNEDNLTLRDEDLPYDATFDDSTAEYSNNELSYNDNIEENNENVELPNLATYVGRLYYFDIRNHFVYRIDVVVDRPNFIRYYYSDDGYNYIYYPYASPIVYDTWWSWSLFRYSSWGSFCHRYPSFNRRVNHYCHSLNFGNGNYGRRITFHDHNYGGRKTNQGHGDNGYYGNGGTKNGHSSYTRPVYTNTKNTQHSVNGRIENQRQPKASQEYINPRSQTSRSYSNPQENSNSRLYTNPSTAKNERRYNSPKNNSIVDSRQNTRPSNNQNRNYTPPTRTNSSPSYSTPARTNSSPSYSTPSRSSSPSYSTPSRSSSPSYSTPSRSNSSGGSGSSGGSSGSGRRK